MHNDYQLKPELIKFKTTLNEFNQFLTQHNACLLGKPLMIVKKSSKDTVQNVTITGFGTVGFDVVGKAPLISVSLSLHDSKGNFLQKTTMVDVIQFISKHVTIPIGKELEALTERVIKVETSFTSEKTQIAELKKKNEKLTSKNSELESEVRRTSPFNPSNKTTTVYKNRPSFGLIIKGTIVLFLTLFVTSIMTFGHHDEIVDFLERNQSEDGFLYLMRKQG